MEHIKDWVKVKEHRFENMILLCMNCHGRVTKGEISKDPIKSYKRNLAITNGRYSLFEMRMIEAIYDAQNGKVAPWITIGDGDIEGTEYTFDISRTDALHVQGLLRDGFAVLVETVDRDWKVSFVQRGIEFVCDYFNGAEFE